MTEPQVLAGTKPEAPPPSPPALSPVQLGRWAWRQLTSMRTALVLLFCLALAAQLSFTVRTVHAGVGEAPMDLGMLIFSLLMLIAISMIYRTSALVLRRKSR